MNNMQRKEKRTQKEWEEYELSHVDTAAVPMTYEEYRKRKLTGKAKHIVDAGLRRIGSAAVSGAKSVASKIEEEASKKKGRKKGHEGNWGNGVLGRMGGF